MVYNCGIATAKRQTKLKLHFTKFSVYALVGLQTLIMVSPDFSLTTLQFHDFSTFFQVSGHMGLSLQTD